jgi:hypothetical protein
VGLEYALLAAFTVHGESKSKLMGYSGPGIFTRGSAPAVIVRVLKESVEAAVVTVIIVSSSFGSA